MKAIIINKKLEKQLVELPKELKKGTSILYLDNSIKIIGEVLSVNNTQAEKTVDFVRECNDEDINKLKNIADYEEKSLEDAEKIVKKQKLDMKILDSTFDFDGKLLLIRFYSEKRIDFRELAKELASIYKTRIELRQVGVRDKAKIVGGYGPCGQQICCQRYLKGFSSVSINMAKKQNISLNPTKINGLCGRLLCCLKYENDNYKKCMECLPKKGSKLITEKGEGFVVDVDILNKKYSVNIKNVGIVEFTCGKD